jgi:Tol biopolymer transport system component
MTLNSGTRLGPYEILSPLGAGGMGEVYRAKDTRLGRDVADKVLPEALASSLETRQRFEREARTISQLSHPHICALYDVGREGETEYLVMELLEGETLAARLTKGPVPLEQALRWGIEIAGALDEAHRRGIVHRDLKPGNVMLTKSGVKLLDFGLARALGPEEPLEDVTSAPTAARDLTEEGTILGTLAYMAPEQLEGRRSDSRTDIFALGAVLYETATGRKAFSGASQASLIAAILTTEPPPVSASQELSPPALDRLVRMCMAKDPGSRWQSAHDVALQLQAIAEGAAATQAAAAPAQASRLRWLPWAVAAAAFAGALAVIISRSPPPVVAPSRSVRFALPPPEGKLFFSSFETTTLAVSPDGSKVAFVAADERTGGNRPTASAESGQARSVWIRDLSALEAERVPGTENASSIFWSPDGRSLGFFTPGQLKRVDLPGGAVIPICDLPVGGGRSGTWGSGGDILFVNVQAAGISRVPAAGGRPVDVDLGGSSQTMFRTFWPWYLPDGKRFLYIAKLREGAMLMFSEPGKPPRGLLPLSSTVQYCDPGYLLFAREGTLLAQRFDWRKGLLEGAPSAVAEHVGYFLTSGHADFAASAAGTIVYQPHRNESRLTWFDRSGRELSTVGSPGEYYTMSLSSDGRELFFDRSQPAFGTYDVWSFDLERGIETRLTSSPRVEYAPLPLSDGKSFVYSCAREAQPQLCRATPGSGEGELLAPVPGSFQIPQAISPDEATLVYTERRASNPFDIWALSLTRPGKPEPLLQSQFGKSQVRFSPDGKYLSFLSDESGRSEAYVMPYGRPGERVRVSVEGAQLAEWSRDGREIIYLSSNERLMAAPVQTAPSLRIGQVVELFAISGKPWLNFLLSRDGKRILAVVPDKIANELPLTVVADWKPASAPEAPPER